MRKAKKKNRLLFGAGDSLSLKDNYIEDWRNLL